MCQLKFPVFILMIVSLQTIDCSFYRETIECGSYGFTCINDNKLRLCEDRSLFGPVFNCPAKTFCNEESSDVCERSINHIDPSFTKALKCRRNERLADPTVPDCKGYVLCVPSRTNKNTFQYIKFKCSGNTIFNGISRTCSSTESYKCPLYNATKLTDIYDNNRKNDHIRHQEEFKVEDASSVIEKPARTIDCKNYKFRVTQDSKPARATYFCPSRPAPNERSIRCTVFSNNFCVTLERDDEDQFALSTGIAYRRPRDILD